VTGWIAYWLPASQCWNPLSELGGLTLRSHPNEQRPAVLGELAGGTEKSVSTETQLVDHSRQIFSRLSISARTVGNALKVEGYSFPDKKMSQKTKRLLPAHRSRPQACTQRQGGEQMITKCLNCGHHRDAHEHYRRSPSDTECALCNCLKFMQRRRGFFGWLARVAGRKR
jgi:hypothetical protein